MRTVRVVRDKSSASGTPGVLLTDSGYSCYTMEPSRDRKEHPCIEEGSFLVELKDLPKHGKCYELQGTAPRTAILLHVGNFAGDPPMKSDSEGCLLLGNAIGEIGGQTALLSSRDAYARFMADMNGESFHLYISWKNTK